MTSYLRNSKITRLIHIFSFVMLSIAKKNPRTLAITFWQVECFLEGTHGVKIDRMGKTGAKLPRAYWDRLVTTRFKKCIISHAFRYQFHQY